MLQIAMTDDAGWNFNTGEGDDQFVLVYDTQRLTTVLGPICPGSTVLAPPKASLAVVQGSREELEAFIAAGFVEVAQ